MGFAKDYNILLNEILTSYRNMGPIVQLDIARLQAERPDIYNEYLILGQPDTSKGSLLFMRAAGNAAMFYGLYKTIDNVIDQFFSSTANRTYLERQASDFLISVLNKSDQELASELQIIKSGKIMGGNKYDYQEWAKQVSLDYTISNLIYYQLTNSGLNNFSPQALIDNDTSTKGFDLDSTGDLIINLGNSTKSFTKINLNINGTSSSAEFEISYSDDGSLWTSLGQLSSLQNGWNELTWSDVGSHQYWKVALITTDSNGNYITELQLFEGPERVLSSIVIPLARSEGTFDIVITSNLNQGMASQDLITAVNLYLQDRRNVAGGYSWGLRVLGPIINAQAISMTGTGLNWNKEQTRSDIISYINNLTIGQPLYISQLIAIAIQNGADSANISNPSSDVIPTIDYSAGTYGLIRCGDVTIS